MFVWVVLLGLGRAHFPAVLGVKIKVLCGVRAGVSQDRALATRVSLDHRRDVVDLAVRDEPARLRGTVSAHLAQRVPLLAHVLDGLC